MTVAVGYTRVSMSDQAEFGVSLDAQKAKIKAYAALYEIELVDIVVDAGESAKSLDRPGIRRCFSILESGDADALLVVKLDRLTRSVKDLNHLLEGYFMGDSYSLISVSENLDTRSATGRMIINIIGVVSQWERETIGERTSAALQYLRSQGRYTGGNVRYGYRIASDGKTLVPDDYEQGIIEIAVGLHEGGSSFNAVAKALNNRGFTSRRGGKFQAVQIRSIVRSKEELCVNS